jgi:hypothetical protein
MRRALIVLLAAVAAWASAWATLQALRPIEAAPDNRRFQPAVQERTRLASHVLFVVVDGLRWDVAHDPNVMPRFAAAMRHHSSAEIWSDPISMTSSAVLAYGTGQRSNLDQVLENLQPPRPRVNSWLQNAHAAGITLMGVGDPIWSRLYGPYFASFLADPVTAAVERDFNAQTFAAARRTQLLSPDFLLVHFVTPDHQGHAYGIRSARYRASMHEFDQRLFAWLEELTPEWTVLVTSDHGATDSGTHGSNTVAQRRSPFFAYGPGIRNKLAPKRKLDQVELPGLFSALLGVANAEQSRGVTPFEWLDVAPEAQRDLACSEIARLQRNASAQTDHFGTLTCCAAQPMQQNCAPAARLAAAAHDARLSTTLGIQSRRAWPGVAVAILAAFWAVALVWGKRALAVGGWLCAWLLVSLMLTLGVERLAGAWPNLIRVALFAGINGALLFCLLGFKQLAPVFERHWALTLSIFPGWLLVSYSTNTQVESYGLLALTAGILVWPALRHPVDAARKSRLAQHAPKLVLVASFATLSIAGTKASDVRPAFFVTDPHAAAAVAGVVLIASMLLLASRRDLRGAIAATALVMLCFLAQHLRLHWLGRAGWLLTALAALFSFRARRVETGWALTLASYAWVARDYEWLVLMPTLLIASNVGRLSSANHSTRPSGSILESVVQVTFLFALNTLLRIGLQGGLQLETLDLAAGTYGDAGLPHWMSGGLLLYKFLSAQVLVLAAYLRHRTPEAGRRLLAGLATCYLGRGGCLLVMLFVCGQSYWTAFRVLADLPFAFAGLLGVALLLFAPRLERRNASAAFSTPASG